MAEQIEESEITNVDKGRVVDYSGPKGTEYEVITHVGNDAENWRMTREDAVKRIKAGKQKFFTRHAKTRTKIPVTIYREQYLRSERDDDKKDNLESLPSCGAQTRHITFMGG